VPRKICFKHCSKNKNLGPQTLQPDYGHRLDYLGHGK